MYLFFAIALRVEHSGKGAFRGVDVEVQGKGHAGAVVLVEEIPET